MREERAGMHDAPVRILADPRPEAAVAFLREELGRRLVQVAARCVVEYVGRAESRLPSGSRLLLLKPDGTLLVHAPTKLKPVNWQPPGCAFSASQEDGRLVLTVTRRRPRETIRILVEDVHLVASLDLASGEDLDLVGTESDLQAVLAADMDLVEPGLRCFARERPSRRGVMDLYGEDALGRRVVVELKRRAAALKDADQLRRYVDAERSSSPHVAVRGILVAASVPAATRAYLAELGLEHRELDWRDAMFRSWPQRRLA